MKQAQIVMMPDEGRVQMRQCTQSLDTGLKCLSACGTTSCTPDKTGRGLREFTIEFLIICEPHLQTDRLFDANRLPARAELPQDAHVSSWIKPLKKDTSCDIQVCGRWLRNDGSASRDACGTLQYFMSTAVRAP